MSDDNRNRNADGNWGHCLGSWDNHNCNTGDDQVDLMPDLWRCLVFGWHPVAFTKTGDFSKRASESFKPKKQIRKFEL